MPGVKYGILTGYDGSPTGTDALCWAMREAVERGMPLTVLLASDLAPPGEPPLHDLAVVARKRGEYALAQGLDYAGSGGAQAEVTAEPAAEALCERSGDAEMVVIGARGHGRLPGLLLGSVPWRVAAHGHGRVVVVRRGGWHPVNGPPGPVVAGIDGSACSGAAAVFAFGEAALRHVPVMAVCALADCPGVLGNEARMKEEFGLVLARLQRQYPDITVSRRVVPGRARSALLEAARGAQLIVVGCSGRTGMTGMLLGSVAQAMLHYSPCPVGVVHPVTERPADGADRPDEPRGVRIREADRHASRS
jgi:nucleotide-binding universal stress UspA family protein